MSEKEVRRDGLQYIQFKDAVAKGFTDGFVYWHGYREPITFRYNDGPGKYIHAVDRFGQMYSIDDFEWVYIGKSVDKDITSAPVETPKTANNDSYAALGTPPRHDEITYPSHYAYSPIQPIDVVESWGLGYHLGTVLKYLCRAGKKTPDTLKDLRKAQWFLSRYISRLEKDANEKTRACDTAK